MGLKKIKHNRLAENSLIGRQMKGIKGVQASPRNIVNVLGSMYIKVD